jgi:hypothetical protein
MATSEPIVIPLVIDGKTIVPTVAEARSELKKLKDDLKNTQIGSDEQKANLARQKELNEAINGQTAATAQARVEGSKLNDTLRGLGPAGDAIADLRDKFSGAKDSATQSVSSFRNVGFAMAAIPIIAIVAGFTALVQYFQKTDEGATRLEGIMGALKITVGLLTKPLIDLGKFLFDAFDNPKKAAQVFVDFLKDQVVNRLNAVMVAGEAVSLVFQGKFTEAAKKAADAAIQLTLGVTNGTDKLAAMADEIGNAAKEAYNLAAAFDSLSDRERDFQVTQKETENQINRLLLQSKNRSLTEQQRMDLLNQASALEEKLHQQELGFARENLALIQQENAALRATGENTDAMAEKETAAKVKLLELDGQSLNLQEKISNRRAALQEQIDAEAAKQIAALEKLRDAQGAYEEEQAKAAEKARQDKIDAIDAQSEEEQIALQKAFFGKVDKQNDLDAQLYKIQKKAIEEKRSLVMGSDTKSIQDKNKLDVQLLKMDSDRAAKELDNEKKTAQLKEKLANDKLSVAKTVLQTGIDLLSQDEESRKKYGAAIKAMTIADMTIDYYKQLSKILGFSLENPFNGVTFGGAGAAVAAIFTAVATARYALGVSQVANQKFALGGQTPSSLNWRAPVQRAIVNALGGEVYGSRHGSNYGDSGIALVDRFSGSEVGEMEGGEGILTRGVMSNPRLRSMASAINVAAGGRSFADGGQAPGAVQTTQIDLNNVEVVNSINAMRQEIASWQRELTVVNVVQDTTDKQAELSKMVQNSIL